MLIVLLSFVWLVVWTVTIFIPVSDIHSVLSFKGGKSGGWLPAPGSFGGLLGTGKVPNENENVYVPGPAYNGYAYSSNGDYSSSQVNFVTYTKDGIRIVRTDGGTVNTNTTLPNAGNGGYAEKSLYIRNLSIYEGGHIYTGISFIGEAKNTMFQNGKFPIIIVDRNGRVATVATAEATTNWSVPGWTRFQTKINAVLPNKTPCTMVFQSAGAYTTSQPTRVAIPILCN